MSTVLDKIASRIRLRTVLIALAMTGGFVIMASIFAPGITRAIGVGGEGPDGFRFGGASETFEPLGQLETAGYTIRIYGSELGARYSVFDERDVRLADMLTADELAEQFPQLSVRGARADVPVRSVGEHAGGR